MNTRLTPKLPVPKKVKIRKAWRIATKSFWILVVLVLIIQLFRLNLFLEKASNTNLDQASAQVEQLQTQLDELREYLLLPTSNTQEDLDDRSEQSLEQFLADLLVSYEREQVNTARNQKILNALDQAYLTLARGLTSSDFTIVEASAENIENTLTTETTQTTANTQSSPIRSAQQTTPSAETTKNQYILLDQEQEPVFSFGFDNTKLFFSSEIEELEFLSTQLEEFKAKLESLNSEEAISDYQSKVVLAQSVKESLDDFAKNTPSQIKTLLNSKNLEIIYDQETPFSLEGVKSDLSRVFLIEYRPARKTFTLLDERNRVIAQNITEFDDLNSSLETYLKLNTFETLIQKNLTEKLFQIQNILVSPVFLNKMAELNLEVSVEEENDYYKILFKQRSSKQVVFQINLDKQSAEVFTETPTTEPTRITFLSPIQESSQNNRTFLIAGKQGSLTDSLILANIDEKRRRISLLSIPRDLYLEGRKINSVYARSDMPTLVSTIENLIGRKIENYVLIDMFAFIDIVDYLGGVEVYLANEISDPTYRTFENGVWSTMYFAAGQHKLNGTQALRLARSRYTSSDFARAERQQMLISSLRNQINSLSFRDLRTFSSIILTLQSKTETDIPLNKAITYFFRYKDYDIFDQNVLSTQNILVSTYSNEYNQVSCENCGRGAYILLPKNEDWSLLQTYVNSIFNS